MSDDNTKKPFSLSTPQATANLDDVLSSLEKKVNVETTTLPVEPVQQAIETPIVVPEQTTPISPGTSFQLEETPIAPVSEIKAPTAESVPSAESMQDHPQMLASNQNTETQQTPVTEASAQEPKNERKGFLSGFSFTPKFIGAALVVALMAIGAVGAYIAFQAPQGSVNLNPKATGCKITYNGTSSFSVTGCAGRQILKFNGPSCPTTQSKVGEETVPDDGTHGYSPNPSAGQCQQVDHNFSDDYGTVGGGVCSCAPASKKSCGESCTSTADCRNPSGNGASVACISGVCQNAACPTSTTPGVNCDCSTATRQCGQTCSAAVGLCAPGQGACTYVNTNGPACPWGWGQFYCTGTLNGYTKPMCTSGDTGGQYLKGPTGKMSGFTAAEIAASCTPVTTTPTPTPKPTATPTPTPSPTPVTNVCVISNISVIPSPNPSDWNNTTMFTLKNNGTTTTTFNYFLDSWTDNTLDKKGLLTLKPGETTTLGLGKICSKWQLDIGCPPKYDDKGYVVEANPNLCTSPTPTPAPLVCLGLTSDTPKPVVGSSVRFTCGKITAATSYEFRYKYSFAGVDQNAATIPANGNVSSPLVISQAATYKVQCRPCVGQSCTPWEAW